MPSNQKNIFIPAGLPGLPIELTEFSLTNLGEDIPFFTLQSLQDENIGFILVNPFALFSDYELDLPETVAEMLELKDPQHAAVFCIVNAKNGLKNATINLLAPLVINTASSVARQVVLNDKRYSIRHPLPILTDPAEEG